MPKYELMYLLSSQVSDDQVPAVQDLVKKYLSDFKAENVVETVIGKKKLAYPIAKTRNGFYVLVNFEMEGSQVNAFEARLRTQKNTIIRHIIVNLEEHLKRKAKDEIVQASLPKRILPEGEATDKPVTKEEVTAPAPMFEEAVVTPAVTTEEKPKRAPRAKKKVEPLEITTEELDKKIDAALSEDLLK